MAVMVPDRLPSRSSVGEQRLFAVLQKLPDECLVYYEPVIGFRYPDFIVVDPDLGVLIVEVKGWRPGDVRGGDLDEVVVRGPHGVDVRERHPIRQARDYMHGLQDQCLGNRFARRLLLHESGPRQGRFVFPFGHFAILSNITAPQLAAHEFGDLTRIFPPARVVPRDELVRWEGLSGEQVRAELARYFDPTWSFPRLTDEQVNAVRAVVHPEVEIPVPPQVEQLAVLDHRQEQVARSVGDGHRILYGVAGSGKTVLLLARAKAIAEHRPNARVLILCFNVTLAAYLLASLSGRRGVSVYHFDGWAKANGQVRRRGAGPELEDDESLGRRLLEFLRAGGGESRRYDAVLVDEAQDWPAVWFECVLEAMREPCDGDLLIVGDRQQGIRGSAAFAWSSVGVNARGRSHGTALGLDRNYRNTREVLEVAAAFARDREDTADEDKFGVVAVDPAKAVRSTGVRPVVVRARSRGDECDLAVQIVRRLTCSGGGLEPGQTEPLEPHEIGVLYRRLPRPEEPAFTGFLASLSDATGVPAVWLRGDDRRRVRDPGIKVQTIHGAKGLQWPAVIVLWADQLRDCPEDSKLMYVALTRPENHLYLTHSRHSPLVDQIRASGKVRLTPA